ncbi:hypothetical protein AX15_002940 [Amanita polypyramis BW_CC]|nr:hypothetical protein AX15_002940 [Amanita polypyramis BW_CC]
MSRLASFRSPSAPSTSPVQHKAPSSSEFPSKTVGSTFHRRLRSRLQELRAIAETWDDLVLLDGLKAAKNLVDTRTDLDNELALIPNRRPRARVVGPKLVLIEKHISELDAILEKLQKLFNRMNTVIDIMEALLIDAQKTKGWKWVDEEPMWLTWSLEKFVSSFTQIIPPYHRSLVLHTQLVDKLRSNSVSFEDSREAIAKWVEQPWLEESGWDAKWEDVCTVEVERWESSH